MMNAQPALKAVRTVSESVWTWTVATIIALVISIFVSVVYSLVMFKQHDRAMQEIIDKIEQGVDCGR